jgi:uracil-DNA glycosylase
MANSKTNNSIGYITDSSWKAILAPEFEKPYFQELVKFVQNKYLKAVDRESVIYPKTEDIFRAFNMCPFDKVKVVILGQDPYHGAVKDFKDEIVSQANGLCFSVNSDVPPPPSLKNIFKEIESDLGIKPLQNALNGVSADNNFEVFDRFDGDLTRWAKQGVLLLNSTLTVQAGMPGSHQKKGWEEFTDTAIHALSDQREHIVFLLWGNYAKQKGTYINRSKHLVLETTHPSPFSVHNGFFGCKHFSKTNEYLREHGLSEIDWR